jgi:hypothetical protein
MQETSSMHKVHDCRGESGCAKFRGPFSTRATVIDAMPKTDDEWDLYATHRRNLTDAIVQSAPGAAGRLCILGAGRCNDVDLERLLRTFSEIHLVDIDKAALAHAVARQDLATRARLHLHAPVDLSGLSEKRLKKWQRKPPSLDEVERAALSTIESIAASLQGPFEVVVSACVLTQMSFALRDALGEKHPMLGPIRLSLMVTHLTTMFELTAVGGTPLFVSDLVSSNFYPLDELPAERNLLEVMTDIVETGASYYAANPNLIRELSVHNELFCDRVNEPELIDPWLWTGPFDRTYLVYAFRFQRYA